MNGEQREAICARIERDLFKRDWALIVWQVIYGFVTAIAALIAADAIGRLRPLAQLLNL
jgi:hypothetical protein